MVSWTSSSKLLNLTQVSSSITGRKTSHLNEIIRRIASNVFKLWELLYDEYSILVFKYFSALGFTIFS